LLPPLCSVSHCGRQCLRLDYPCRLKVCRLVVCRLAVCRLAVCQCSDNAVTLTVNASPRTTAGTTSGCTNPAQGRLLLCVTHKPKKKCSVPGCTSNAIARHLCTKHDDKRIKKVGVHPSQLRHTPVSLALNSVAGPEPYSHATLRCTPNYTTLQLHHQPWTRLSTPPPEGMHLSQLHHHRPRTWSVCHARYGARFPNRTFHSRVPLGPTPARLNSSCVRPMAFLTGGI
jgi:hypothetical protein